jgi:hypothetical protein
MKSTFVTEPLLLLFALAIRTPIDRREDNLAQAVDTRDCSRAQHELAGASCSPSGLVGCCCMWGTAYAGQPRFCPLTGPGTKFCKKREQFYANQREPKAYTSTPKCKFDIN